LAIAAGVRKQRLWVFLLDGRIVSLPIAWFPRLANAKAKQRRHVVIEEAGLALHWPELDEDLGVEPLLTNVPVILPASEKSRRGSRRTNKSKKRRKTHSSRPLRDGEEFALAEVNYPDPIQAHRIPEAASGMREQTLIEIRTRHLGPLPYNLPDRAVEDYQDAVRDIRDLVSEVERLRVATGQQQSAGRSMVNPDEEESADAAWRQHIKSIPKILSRQPTLRGTGLTVKEVLWLLSAGMTADEILSEYRYLERGDILAALEYAAETVPDKIPE
jgi:uncharacterized protein (DUF433 family)